MKKLSKKILCVCIFSSVSLAAFSADIFGALNKVNSAVLKRLGAMQASSFHLVSLKNS